TATGLAATLPISRQAVAKHLKLLHDAGLVSSRRRGREALFELEPEPLGEAVAWIGSVAAEGDPPLARLPPPPPPPQHPPRAPRASSRQHPPRPRRVGPDLLPEIGDVDVAGALVAFELGLPELLHDLRAGEPLAGPAGEQPQQLKLGAGQVDRGAAHGGDVP